MVSPSLVLIALVALYPIIYAIWLSLHEYSLLEAGLSRWAEPNAPFGNYSEALWGDGSSEFWAAIAHTFIFTIVSVVLETDHRPRDGDGDARGLQGPGPPAHRRARAVGVLTVVTAIMWQTIFEPELGFVNSLLGAIGLPDDTVWLGRGAGGADGDDLRRRLEDGAVHGAARCSPGCRSIPGEIYEAAKVDGATAWQRFQQDHAAAADAGDARRADLPHARRAARSSTCRTC